MNETWTEQETLLLLDKIAEYGEEWDQISSELKKDKTSCVVHFINLPLNENVLEKINFHSNNLSKPPVK